MGATPNPASTPNSMRASFAAPDNENATQNRASDKKAQEQRTAPKWGGDLTEADYTSLESCWITRDIADAAMLRRVDNFDGREVIGQKGKRNCTGILIPYYWPGEPHIYNYRLRRDNPEYNTNKDGKLKENGKYLGPPNSSNRLYVPPSVSREQLENISVPIVIVEGEKKSLALARLATHGTETPRFAPIAIPGVWSWRGRVGKGTTAKGERVDVKGPIPDLDRIQWKSRPVVVLFDRNVHSEDSVKWARTGLARELARRGAKVEFVTLPEGCGVNGIDDLLAAWGAERVLELFEERTPGASVAISTSTQFMYKPEGMFRFSGREQMTQVQIANFTAVITAHTCVDDGVETKKDFEIEVELHGRKHLFSVPASEFARMDWVIERVGPSAIVFPNQRDYARTAIQAQFMCTKERRVYAHTGWRQIDGQSLFLHAGGAISAAGPVPDVSVILHGALNRYNLPLPANAERAVAAVKASLKLLHLGPSVIMFPLLAATYRSVLGEADFAVYLAGPTGSFKSEIAALVQQHFGVEMDSRHLPASWSSTPNSLESVAFHAKDVLLVVDDFAPNGNQSDIARQHASADRVFRASGNHSGRGRLDSSAKLKQTKPPRSLILSTGEDVPRGQSIRARLLILEMEKGSIQSADLSACQNDARVGLYVEAMSAFVQWLAGRLDEVRESFRRRVIEHRDSAKGRSMHARTPDIVANLQSAFEILLDFAVSSEAIDKEEASTLGMRCWHALCLAADAQSDHQVNSEPTEHFLIWLRSLLSSGRAHLESPTGAVPEFMPEACGWRRNDPGSWTAQGDCMGWVKDDAIYLEPATTFRLIQLCGRDVGEPIAISDGTLKRRLSEKGLLASSDKKRGTHTVRKQLGGSQKQVLHLSWATVFGANEE